MAEQYVALPLNQEREPRQFRPSVKVLLSVMISLSCLSLWASCKYGERVVDKVGASSLAMQPMQQVIQPARLTHTMPMPRVRSRKFMELPLRATANDVEEATRGGAPSRRSILAGLVMLPLLAVADQAKAAPTPKLKADNFGPYFNYAGDLAVTGKVNVEGSTTGQTLSWDLTGLDPKCEAGPGAKPNSCGVHIHKGESCKEDALGHYYATAEDPWKTITYTSKKSPKGADAAKMSNVKVTTDLTNADFTGRAFIVHDFEGARVACSILK